MSNKNLTHFGNDTIHRYPLSHEGNLRKILCISKEVFKKLKAALAEFGLRLKPALPKPKTPFRKKLPQKRPLGYFKNDNLKPDRDKCIGSFEPSNIFNTQSSSFFKWRRMEAWFKEQRLYEDGDWQYREISIGNKEYNEKRHIY